MYLGIKLLRTSYYWQLKEDLDNWYFDWQLRGHDLDKDLELLSEHLNSFNPCGQIGRSNTTLSWYFTIDEKFIWFWIGLVLQFINIILAGLFYMNLLKIFKKSPTQTKSSQNSSAYEKLRSPTCESKKIKDDNPQNHCEKKNASSNSTFSKVSISGLFKYTLPRVLV